MVFGFGCSVASVIRLPPLFELACVLRLVRIPFDTHLRNGPLAETDDRMRLVRRRVWLIRALLLLALPILSFVGWNQWTANFAAVRPGEVYRSGQMGPGTLHRTLGDRGVKTVLNLRGHHPETAWYRDELAATLAKGATQIDVALSSCEWMSKAQARALVDILDHAERPILIHCFHGSERTGLISAFSELLRPGSTFADARDQFSVGHLYLPIGDGVVMPHHLDAYEAWLSERGGAHAPDTFRLWVAEGYTPGSPSREEWPFDPYPLKVVTKVAELPGTTPEVRIEWTPGSEPGGARRTAEHPNSARR